MVTDGYFCLFFSLFTDGLYVCDSELISLFHSDSLLAENIYTLTDQEIFHSQRYSFFGGQKHSQLIISVITYDIFPWQVLFEEM